MTKWTFSSPSSSGSVWTSDPGRNLFGRRSPSSLAVSRPGSPPSVDGDRIQWLPLYKCQRQDLWVPLTG